ncbi:Uncharacterized membrane protein YgdD, TMEM256/DUF423 family [Arboricoccus pini]|uniref:Uncharacterized membrane protein YgdD, TMEM256/DUF423 family n=1 Tax=Arboricoccus pini TaxID=1963835 RepID=A0A212Q103_9PROT|nr:DUF423 domain-containing protein [Arboricoccus pini]SNB52963.1 Uncharacterized membrane protein YgdD, TMEM256/DUF423 family [Arboricoccus pini]
MDHLSLQGRLTAVLAALLAALSVGGGAFAAHAMSGDARAQHLLGTGAAYGLWHALAALFALSLGAETIGLLFTLGVLLFSPSLFGLALGAPPILGVITPIGGTAFILGWLLLAWRLWRR